MIRVEGLQKVYGGFEAVRGISFEVGRGEVVGLLGPNGAGKTTTMRIVCGCIGATAGRALIDGRDVLEDPRGVKRRVGYLPEVPPVYPTMTVEDYVRFAATIKEVDDPEAAADRAIGRVGLAEVRHRVIDHLSKGYRQRVGLAQALVHDPDVLVLDEPTSGLDPAQRVEIRELLRDLAAGERTVILSTHILPEVEAVAERVIIMHQGRVVAQDRIDALESGGAVRLRVARPGPEAEQALRAVPGVSEVEGRPDGRIDLRIDGSDDTRAAVAAAAVPFGLLELTGGDNLEAVYLRLTAGGEGPDPRENFGRGGVSSTVEA
ncbi:MAG: ABC transporter ATP-binding protein [Deltaproteobacteria bacterium]|nr:MAG: ABC transporter ATP-binding protein [Deltaproteobacteria bacterium]